MNKPSEMKIALTLEYIQSLLDKGERVVISRTGIDSELHDQDEPAECLMNAHEYVAGLMDLQVEKKLAEQAFKQKLKDGWEQEKKKLRKLGV
jgi:hypothetical protein